MKRYLSGTAFRRYLPALLASFAPSVPASLAAVAPFDAASLAAAAPFEAVSLVASPAGASWLLATESPAACVITLYHRTDQAGLQDLSLQYVLMQASVQRIMKY